MGVSLGIHIGHDGGAAIMKDGQILAAISEERFTRKKYSNGWRYALDACLKQTHYKLDDIDCIVISNAGAPLNSRDTIGLERLTSQLLPKVLHLDHHLSHALCSFAMSGMDEGLVHVSDAGGNWNNTQTAFLMNRNDWTCILVNTVGTERCQALGTTYEAFTNYLGFFDQESGKTMALAAYGNPEAILVPVYDVLDSGEIVGHLKAPHQWGVKKWLEENHIPIGDYFLQANTTDAKNLAAYIQNRFEDSLMKSLDLLGDKYHVKNICISGGTGLNCIANSKLKNKLKHKYKFYFCPLCSDAGLPVGNAVYGQWSLDGVIPNLSQHSIFQGPEYQENDIIDALMRNPDMIQPGGIRRSDISYEKSDNVERIAAEMIADGKVIAWWQGRSEIGPRALGNRSILANPRLYNIRQIVNEKIKEREWFRPFGASLIEEDIGYYIDSTDKFPYMIEAPYVSASGMHALGECIHVDGSSRIQTVCPFDNHKYYLLLKELKEITGYGCVLNTSFNIQEPIVETPADAVATFLRSEIDALVIDNYICYHKK